MKKLFLSVLAAIFTLALTMPLATPALAGDLSPACHVDLTKTASGFHDKTIEWDWTVAKSVEPETLELEPGATDTVTYTIGATRNVASQSEQIGVRGTITIGNYMGYTMCNIKITDEVKYKKGGTWHVLTTTTIVDGASISNGAIKNYPYEIQFTPVDGATAYKNVAMICWGKSTAGGCRMDLGGQQSTSATFSIPATSITGIDEAARVVDVETCPDGFTCVHNGPTEWDFTDSGSVQFTKDITNDSIEGCAEATLPNTVTLTENDTLQQRTDDATVEIDIPCCECEEAVLALLSNPSAAKVGETATLTALLQDEDGAPIVGHPVDFYNVTDPVEEFLGTVNTDDEGKASLQVTEDEAITATYEARVSFNGEECDPAQASVVWTTGGGSIPGVSSWSIIAMVGAMIIAAFLMLRRRALA